MQTLGLIYCRIRNWIPVKEARGQSKGHCQKWKVSVGERDTGMTKCSDDSRGKSVGQKESPSMFLCYDFGPTVPLSVYGLVWQH